MFNALRQETTSRILQIRLFLNELDGLIPTPPTPPSSTQNAQKGLFFVYLYGVLESIISKTVRVTIDLLNSSNIGIHEVVPNLFSLLLDAEFESLRQIGDGKKWERRWDVCERISCQDNVIINQEILPTDGKNIRKKQITSINKSFGNTLEIFTQPQMDGYLTELVDHRNHIAHGDSSPESIGRSYTIDQLRDRLTSIDNLLNNFIDSYEMYISRQKFKK